jgi:hypothetical protein
MENPNWGSIQLGLVALAFGGLQVWWIGSGEVGEPPISLQMRMPGCDAAQGFSRSKRVLFNSSNLG